MGIILDMQLKKEVTIDADILPVTTTKGPRIRSMI